MAVNMAEAWGLKPHFVQRIGAEAPAGLALPCFDAGAYIESIVAGKQPPPHFAIDLSDWGAGLVMCREFLERLHVPLVTTASAAAPRSFDLPCPSLHAATEAELWSAMRALALESPAALAKRLAPSWLVLERDGGWAWLWRTCKNLFETRAAQNLIE
jgi:hypothetical protein